MTWKVVYDFVLAGVFLFAAHKILRAALEGRRQIRIFRYVGAGLAFAWSAFFVGHGVDLMVDVVPFLFWDWAIRILTSSVAMMFIVWGCLFNERNWPRG